MITITKAATKTIITGDYTEVLNWLIAHDMPLYFMRQAENLKWQVELWGKWNKNISKG